MARRAHRGGGLRCVAAVALAGWCGLLAQTVHAADKGPTLVGAMAPDFKARDAVTRAPIHLGEQQGKVVVLTFWATWCAPCRKELPILENLQRKLSKDSLLVYAVPFNQPEYTYGSLVKSARNWQITLVDDPNGSIARRYGIKGIPHLFVIGRDGRIVADHLGYGERSVEKLVDDVNAALRGPPPPTPGDTTPPSPAQ